MVAMKTPRVSYDRRVYMGVYRRLPAKAMDFTLDRLTLRDSDRYFQATSNWEMALKLGGAPLESLGKAKAIVKSTYFGYESGAATRLAIRDREGKLAGVVSITRPKSSDYNGRDMLTENTSTSVWEIGYWLLEEYRGHGVGTSAVRKAMEILASAVEGRSTTVIARCWANNFGSLRLLQKCGFNMCFSQNGRQGTMQVYSLKLV